VSHRWERDVDFIELANRYADAPCLYCDEMMGLPVWGRRTVTVVSEAYCPSCCRTQPMVWLAHLSKWAHQAAQR
jgi:hypothetical protein